MNLDYNAFKKKTKEEQEKLSNKALEKFALGKIRTFLYWYGKCLSQISLFCLIGWLIIRKIKQSKKSIEFLKRMLMYFQSKV